MANDTHIPHSLRIAIFFLRLAVGIGLAYLGWSMLFNPTFALELHTHSLPDLYGWLGGTPSIGAIGNTTVFNGLLSPTAPFAGIPAIALAWLFLLTGLLITIGLFTRLASLVAVVLVLANLLPAISFSHFNAAQFVNDEILLLFALLVIILGRAGQYLGVDMFVHVSKRNRS